MTDNLEMRQNPKPWPMEHPEHTKGGLGFQFSVSAAGDFLLIRQSNQKRETISASRSE